MTTDYSKMTDQELIKAYYDETEPLTQWHIASHIRDEKKRRRLISDAKIARQRDEEDYEWD